MSVDNVAGPLALALALRQLADALQENEQLHVALDHLQVGLERRTVVGQAQGILMERLTMDAENAFAYLRRMSNDSNRKLYDVAQEIVETRHLPDAVAPGRPGSPLLELPGLGRQALMRRETACVRVPGTLGGIPPSGSAVPPKGG